LDSSCFLLYINDIDENTATDPFVHLLADDSVLYRIIKSPEDHNTLQHDLNNIIEMGKHLADEDKYMYH